jgi:soluble lytic murein transglycosylase
MSGCSWFRGDEKRSIRLRKPVKCIFEVLRWGSPITKAVLMTTALCLLAPAGAQNRTDGALRTSSDSLAPVLEAKDAFQKRDRDRLAQLRSSTTANQNPLALWVAYWDMNLRISELQAAEVDAFYARYPGSYVEDRFRNDWLLELGRRRDWASFAADFPRFRMNDDREVTCYAFLTDHLAGKDVTEAARAAWLAQREADDGCAFMATTLFEAKRFSSDDVWRKARFAVDTNRPRSARQAVALLGADAVQGMAALLESPSKYLATQAHTRSRLGAELATLALMRLAADDPDNVARLLRERWQSALPPDLASWAWAIVGKQTAMKLLPGAVDCYERAAQFAAQAQRQKGAQKNADTDNRIELDWPDDTLAWKARAALRGNGGKGQWAHVQQAIDSMTAPEQRDPTWVYWKARALQALSRATSPKAQAEDLKTQAQTMLASIAGQFHFYGKLASEDLGQPITLPPKPAPLTDAEMMQAQQNLGLRRALVLIGMGLRGEGVREWNFSLRGMNDRQLLAAAQLACNQQVWDRCINTSDRTKVEVDLNQRFPMPFRKEVVARTKEIGLDAAYVYGLIRQESRFIMDARSHVGASGLMQVMPATARWTAKKLEIPYTTDLITDRDTNIAIGTGYLKLVLDDLEGSQPLAAAAYNAGPSRPRRWREGPNLEPAAWAENIPFNETRDYVKKVMSNATYYAALLGGNSTVAPSLKARLGKMVGPRDNRAGEVNKELP